MRKFLTTLSLCLLAAGPAAAWTHPDSSDGPDDNASLPNAWSIHARERAMLGEIVDRLHRGSPDYVVMAQHLREVLEDKGFSTLTPGEQHYAYVLYGGALFASKQYEIARTALRHASEMPGAAAADWDLRLKTALALADYPDAARAATQLAQHWPDALQPYDDRLLGVILAETRKNTATTYLADGLVTALNAAHRHPADAPPAG